MKKYFGKFLLCFLAVAMIFSQYACAESILPDISQLIPEKSEEYPSFSVVCDTEPLTIRETESNEAVYHYANVSVDDYNAFGVALQEKGYANEAVEQLSDSINVTVAKGNNSFTIVYYFLSGDMDVIYPAGAVIEAKTNDSAFENYTEFKKGDALEVPGFGKINISDCIMNNDRYTWVYCLYDATDMWSVHDVYDLTYKQTRDISGQLVLEGTFTNTSKAKENLSGMLLDSMEKDSGVKIYLAYFNGDTSYIFEEGYFGTIGKDHYDEDIFYMNHCRGITQEIPLFKQMDTFPLGIVVDVPENVQTSREGTLALVIEAKSGMYYMKLRENGKSF